MTETTSEDKPGFFARHPSMVLGVGLGSLFLATVLAVLLFTARDMQIETLSRYDRAAVAENADLPGPKNRISKRSEQQIAELLSRSPHVLGGWALKLSYNKTESPILYYWARIPLVDETMKAYQTQQVTGKGYSSEELNKMSAQSIRNAEEAKSGLIRCGPLEKTNLPKIYPPVTQLARGVCRATLPPFDDNVNLGIVVMTDIDGDDTGPEIQAVRRILLQLQIDIFNRDYQGRETWAAPIR